MRQQMLQFFNSYVRGIYFPDLNITDILEIIILTFLIYRLMLWIKNTKAWMLLRGIVIIAVFILAAALLQMHTILWIAGKVATVLATAAVIVFQPELRRGLEKLGENQMFSSVVPLPFENREKTRFSQQTIDGIIEAVYQMSRVKTGALIVVEQLIQLTEYENTGIQLDCIVSSQVVVNIFEHNTPLHDGAIIVRGDRIVAATCYLPLSDNGRLSKELGTRHRAAVGMSEVSDALVIVVSEETGDVSAAKGGELIRAVDERTLRELFESIQDRRVSQRSIQEILKGKRRNEREDKKQS